MNLIKFIILFVWYDSIWEIMYAISWALIHTDICEYFINATHWAAKRLVSLKPLYESLDDRKHDIADSVIRLFHHERYIGDKEN